MSAMKIAVLGATGTIGSLISAELESTGHEVVAASRGSGVDVLTGDGLDSALDGVDAVVDALNIETMSARKAVQYFTTTARHVVEAARRARVGRIVCVSIAGAADPKVNRWFGYYAGKAAQEEVYRESGVAVTLVHSTQWFELIADVVRRASLGPVAVLPTMRMAAVAADSAARLVVAEAVGGSSEDAGRSGVASTADGAAGSAAATVREVAIRGPQTATAAQIARRILSERGSINGRRPRAVVELPFLGRAIARGGLIPQEARVDDVTLDQWLTKYRRGGSDQ